MMTLFFALTVIARVVLLVLLVVGVLSALLAWACGAAMRRSDERQMADVRAQRENAEDRQLRQVRAARVRRNGEH